MRVLRALTRERTRQRLVAVKEVRTSSVTGFRGLACKGTTGVLATSCLCAGAREGAKRRGEDEADERARLVSRSSETARSGLGAREEVRSSQVKRVGFGRYSPKG